MPVRSRAVTPLLVCLVILGAVLLASAENASGAGWTWKSKGKIPAVSGSADAVSCPTTTLCVAAGSDRIYWTTTPTGLGRAWKSVRFASTGSAIGGGYITTDVDCPTATLCVAGDIESNVLTSTAPTSGLAGWVRSPLPSDTYVGVQALSCASTTLCGMLDVSGYALTSVTPGGFGNTWVRTPIARSVADLYDISCKPTVCIASDATTGLAVTNAPAGQPAPWARVTLQAGGRRIKTVACGSARLCLAAGDGAKMFVSTAPAATRSAWRAIKVPGAASGIDHLFCKSASLCFALSGTTVLVSTTPGRAASWKKVLVTKGVILSAMSCPTARQCVLVDVSGKVWVGKR